MSRGMKQAIALMLALMLTMFACAIGEEEAEVTELRRLRLGSSVYTVMIDDDFVAGDLTEAQMDDGQIACFQNDETGLDMDVFQLSKEDGSRTLSRFTLEEAMLEEKVEVVWPEDEINDIDVGWYWAYRMKDDELREVAVYILDSGDSFLELVFWPAAEDLGMEILDIMDSVNYMELKEIRLGTSAFTLIVPDDYVMGEMSDEDIADDQVAYWYSDASTMDFDVYQFSKQDVAPVLADYAVEESSTYPAVTEIVTDGEINLTPVAWYRAVDECDEGEYDTITYIIDGGDEYIEVVFWLDGVTADAEADFIIHNLINESLLTVDEEEADD